jgi:putative membrane protein
MGNQLQAAHNPEVITFRGRAPVTTAYDSAMKVIAGVAISAIAIEHFGFLILEMFLWSAPLGRRIFGLTVERARDSAALAANQGLYNGFLAAGLLWSLFAGFSAQLFFLTCVIIAGVFGAFTAKRSILWVQAAPAAVALILVVLS